MQLCMNIYMEKSDYYFTIDRYRMNMGWDMSELANAVSILPFAYFTASSANLLLRSAITVFYSCSFIYHIALFNKQYELAGKLLIGDTISQIVNVIFLCNSSPYYPVRVKYITSVVYIGGVLRILYVGTPYCRAYLQKRLQIVSISIFTHVSHMAIAIVFIGRYHDEFVYHSLQYLCLTAICFVVDELVVHMYAWAVGHIMCFFYTLYCWKALGVLGVTRIQGI